MRCPIVFIALLTNSPFVSAFFAGELSYSLRGLPITAVVDGRSPDSTAINIEVPATIFYESDGTTYTVTEIDGHALREEGLNSVTLPDSVVKIGEAAFYGNGLTSVSLGSGLQVIVQDAFRGNALTSVTIPDSVTKIGSTAFYLNTLKSVSFGENVLEISNDAFRDNQLSSLVFPESVKKIGRTAFYRNPLESASFRGDYSTAFDADMFGSMPPNAVYACDSAIGWEDKFFFGVPVTLTKTACVAEAPTKPAIEATEAGDEEISLTISATYDGNREIVKYDAVCTDGDNNFSGTSTTARVTVGGLSNGTPYSCTVTVTNSEDLISPSSDPSAFIVPEWHPQGLPVWLLYEASKSAT